MPTLCSQILPGTAILLLFAGPAACQTTSDPFPDPIEAVERVVVVDVVDFATLPDVEGEPVRMMKLVHETGTDRLFVNGMRGGVYTVDPTSGAPTLYLDIDDPRWGVAVESSGRERGFQSFAIHPGFADPGSEGHGRFYTWTDSRNTTPSADFLPESGEGSHHTVLLEWRARTPSAAAYDGGPPRELARFQQPYGNHNAGEIAFDPLAGPGDPDYGLLYVGSADGGSGGDPQGMAQDPGSAFGKILRIDPLGSDGPTGEYGIPPDNPFVGDAGVRPEIYALGVRNPQHLAWDPATGRAFVGDIGQNTVEEVSPLTPGANLGWNAWEGSFRFVGREGVSTEAPRSDPGVTYPVVEYDQADPLLGGRVAVTGLEVYRSDRIPALRDRLLFGDLPSGELFHVDADDLPGGGQDAVRRVLFRESGGGEPRTLLELVQARNRAQGREPAARVDLKLATDASGRLFLLNKHDGTIRVAGGGAR